MAKISVIMPVYNCEAFVEEAVRSVTDQSEKGLEIIIVNDGSTDGTLEILERLGSTDVRISIHSRPNSGKPAIARNLGLAYARGKYIAFLDADDVYHPEKIEKAIHVFEKWPVVDFVFHDVKKFHSYRDEPCHTTLLSNVEFVRRASTYFMENSRNVYICGRRFYNFLSVESNVLHTSSVMFRRNLLELEGVWFREDLLIGEDSDFWLRLTKGNRVGFINEVLSYYRQREGSVTSNIEEGLRSIIFVHSENLKRGRTLFSSKEIRKYRSKISMDHFHLGYYHFKRMEKTSARAAYMRSILLKPRLRTLTAFLKTFVPNWVLRFYYRAPSKINEFGKRT